MKFKGKEDDFYEAIKKADLSAKRRAFRNRLPYAILQDGNVVLVFPDKHTELATPALLDKLRLRQS